MSAQPDNVVRIANDAPVERMGAELLKALVDELRVAGASWQQLSKDQQDSVIARMRSRVQHEVQQAVNQVVAGAQQSARVKVESVTVKDGAKIVLKTLSEIHDVIDHVGKDAVLIMCDPAQFFGGMDEVEGEADQPGLPLGGDDDAPEMDDE